MSENRPINEVAVDRRDGTVVTQQPGYTATEQVTRDVAAERWLGLLAGLLVGGLAGAAIGKVERLRSAAGRRALGSLSEGWAAHRDSSRAAH
jgi:hypothetical protein